jgi:uncharacterized membrane protein
LFSIFTIPFIDAAKMGSYNNTELDLLQAEGEGIPREMVKNLEENKLKWSLITSITNLTIGMALFKRALVSNLY